MVGETFQTLGATGMYLTLAGFLQGNNGNFPIVGAPAETTIAIYNPGAVVEAGVAPDANHIYSVTAGAGPIPGGFDFLPAGGPDGLDITVTKAAGPVAPGFTATIRASGEGLTLAAGSALPHLMPTTAQDVPFSCAPADGGDCGLSRGVIVGWVLSGRTTDAVVSPASPTSMPTPVTQYATFTCLGQLGLATVTLPQGALTAVLGTSPTRIETRVIRITANVNADGIGLSRLIAGHGFVGFTTP